MNDEVVRLGKIARQADDEFSALLARDFGDDAGDLRYTDSADWKPDTKVACDASTRASLAVSAAQARARGVA